MPSLVGVLESGKEACNGDEAIAGGAHLSPVGDSGVRAEPRRWMEGEFPP